MSDTATLERLRAAIKSWKEWHNKISVILGCQFVERSLTVQAIEQLQAENKALLSKSNAWERLNTYRYENWKTLPVHEGVERELLDSGCYSAWIHIAQFVDALIEENKALKERVAELEGLERASASGTMLWPPSSGITEEVE